MRPNGLVSIIGPDDKPVHERRTGWSRWGDRAHMLFVDHGVFRTFFNTRKQISDEMWRSSQPLPYQIASAARAGVKTIINLRGPTQAAAYRLEEEFAQRHRITLVNFIIFSREAPPVATILAARDMFQSIDYPALMHCKSGADRAGLMSALYLHIRKGVPMAEARRQLSLRWGHVKQAKTGILDYFLDTYIAYDARTPTPFFDWLTNVYDRDALTRSFRTKWWASVVTDKILRRE